MIAKERDILNLKYMEAYRSYENASNEENREACLNQMRQFVRETAEYEGFHNTIPEQTTAYKLRISRIPMKTVKVYKVFTLSDDGAPTALFISGTEKLPKGVWLDARDAFHFTAKNGNDYVPSTQNPYTDGGKTGASIEIPSEEVRAELIRHGFLPKGSRAKKITALAYRPGWHAGTLPFFPQGGRKAPKGSPYPMIHRYNQVVFECEIAADTDYTEIARSQKKALTKDGHLNLSRADLQYMPKNGFYYYATNPLTQNNPNLGAWTISGSIKINRALTQEECDVILEDHDMRPQAWEQGILQLDSLGYTGDESEAARKTLAPITYDDEGNVIPLSRRFNASVQDVRYQERMGSEAIHRVEGLTTSEDDEQDLKDSLGEDGKHVYEKLISVLSEGNEAVKNAASVGAAILASHAKAWSEAETAAGRKKSAEDYLETINAISNKPVEDLERIKKEHPTCYLGSEQQRKGVMQGRTDFLTNGKRIVNIFEKADETTFLHEVAHVMYDDLKNLSELDEVAEKDLKTIDEWAEWKPGQIEEYRGTAWEKEFIRRDVAIRVAIKSENTAAEQALRAEWREERFARGFERYLEKGKAPTHVLQGVFDRAKRIFQNAYAAFRGNGGRPSPAVEGVMNRLFTFHPKKEKHKPITSQNRDDIVFEAMKILSKNVQRTEKEATKMRREFNHIIKGFTEVQDFLTYVKKNKTEICREMGFNQSARPDRNKGSIKTVR